MAARLRNMVPMTSLFTDISSHIILVCYSSFPAWWFLNESIDWIGLQCRQCWHERHTFRSWAVCSHQLRRNVPWKETKCTRSKLQTRKFLEGDQTQRCNAIQYRALDHQFWGWYLSSNNIVHGHYFTTLNSMFDTAFVKSYRNTHYICTTFVLAIG